MISRCRSLTVALSVALGALLAAAPSDAQSQDRGCVTVKPGTSLDFPGYLHYATISNGCSAAVRCSLWTDVDPPPLIVEVDAGQSAELTFRRASPVYEFRAFARCQFR